jgi:hypothetical protein
MLSKRKYLVKGKDREKTGKRQKDKEDREYSKRLGGKKYSNQFLTVLDSIFSTGGPHREHCFYRDTRINQDAFFRTLLEKEREMIRFLSSSSQALSLFGVLIPKSMTGKASPPFLSSAPSSRFFWRFFRNTLLP